MRTLMSWIITIGVFLCGIIAILAVSPVKASERHHDHQTIKTEYVYLSKDNESAKYVIGGAILTCLALSAYYGRWCWEEKKPDPTTDTGQTIPNDVTPDR